MLDKNEIENNKERFLYLVNSIERPGMDKELLVKQLIQSDFFTAPASTNYHCSYPGGLCEHSLDVYDNLCKLVKSFSFDVDSDTLKIVALFHDFSKMNCYVEDVKNKKHYNENGSKEDSVGRYDWESYKSYTYKDFKNRFMIGNHEENSVFMINTFIPLRVDEYCAILHHHGGLGNDSTKQNPIELWKKYPLSLFLYQADCISSFIQESNE